MDEQDLKLIFNAIESGRCLAFLGAGACTAFRRPNGEDEPGLPAGKQLAQWLAEKCQYTNGSVYDLFKVAEYFLYAHAGDRELLEGALREKIQIHCPPRPIHTALAQLAPIKIIITSNYDTLLEQELFRCNRRLIKHVYNSQNPKTGLFEGPVAAHEFGEMDVVLHKMHGSIDEPGSLVITQSDYIRYLANLLDRDRGMPDYFRRWMIPRHTLLFLGYSLEDWNFQVIWDGVLASQVSARDAYAIMRHPSHFQKKYWSRRHVEILDLDLTEFARRLAERFNLEIPQLGLTKKPVGGPA